MHEIAEYSLTEAIADYLQLISNYPVFYFLLIAAVVFCILIMVNFNEPTAFYITLFAFLLLIVVTFYFRRLDMFEHIDSIFSWNFIKNMYFYYWNTIVAFLVVHATLSSKRRGMGTKLFTALIYVMLVTNVVYSFFITEAMQNVPLLVLGNISPMILIGNLLAIGMYIFLIIVKFIAFIRPEDKLVEKRRFINA